MDWFRNSKEEHTPNQQQNEMGQHLSAVAPEETEDGNEHQPNPQQTETADENSVVSDGENDNFDHQSIDNNVFRPHSRGSANTRWTGMVSMDDKTKGSVEDVEMFSYVSVEDPAEKERLEASFVDFEDPNFDGNDNAIDLEDPNASSKEEIPIPQRVSYQNIDNKSTNTVAENRPLHLFQEKNDDDGGIEPEVLCPARVADEENSASIKANSVSSSKRFKLKPRSTNNELIRHLNQPDHLVIKADEMSPALKRRLRDFNFAQRKRGEKYGEKSPWGIIGLYDHLTGVRTDVEWAEDAAWRREHSEPYLSWSDFEDAKDTGMNQPFFTYIILLVCSVCLIFSIRVNGWRVESLTVNPMIGPSAQTLVEMGAKKTSLIVKEDEWYRLFTPMVLHAGIIHYVLNMLALWFIGYAVEQSHGFWNVAILFIVPAIGGNIMSALFLPEYISVGASGGIFGLIGACIADIVTNWNLLFSRVLNNSDDGSRFRNIKVLIWLLMDILLNILIGLTPFVDNFTHLGGMIYGFLCGLSKLERLSTAFFGVKKGLFSKFQTNLVRFFGLALSIICICISVYVLAESDGKRVTNCRGCRYVSCVPFPFWSSYDKKWWYCDDCDIVSADARQNKITNLYSSMNLTCPDDSLVNIDLSAAQISDQVFLQKQLPGYCRDHCEDVFSD